MNRLVWLLNTFVDMSMKLVNETSQLCYVCGGIERWDPSVSMLVLPVFTLG